MSLSQEILSIIHEIQEGINDYAYHGGIQVGVGDETTRTGNAPSGYDTVPPRLQDLDIAAAVSTSGNSYYESLEDAAYFATTVGVGKKADTDGFIEPKPNGDRVFMSRSKAIDEWIRLCKSWGFKTFALVLVDKNKCNLDGTFTERLKVLHVEYIPVSDI